MRLTLSPWSGRYLCRGVLACSPRRCVRHGSTSSSKDWEVVIGLEIHAQLRTGRKLFSVAPLSHGDAANTHVESHDAAIPGTLPVLDLNAIRLSIMTALAMGCTINPRSTFDRKHYFYHDIPASYQITQHYNPLARDGTLPIEKGENGSRRSLTVGIQQLQVEQDTAKSQRVGDDHLVDLNRAGTGLMEIVTHPDMRSAEEAGAFVRKLQSLLRRVGSSDGDMDKGNLRVDANVSVHRPGTPFGTRCEIKNLNSIRFLQTAIEYERRRHIEHYGTSDIPLKQETRTLNETTGQTVALRSKEDAEDYRYMPDSNLPALIIGPEYVEALRGELPELPWQAVDRLAGQYGVAKRDLETLVGLDEFTAKGIMYFEDVTAGEVRLGRRALNLIVHEFLGQLYRVDKAWTGDIIPANLMRELVIAVEERHITGTTAKAVIKHLIDSPTEGGAQAPSVDTVLAQLGLTPSPADSVDVEAVCLQAIDALPDSADLVRSGKEKAVMRIVGEVMKRTNGRADAAKAREILLQQLLPK